MLNDELITYYVEKWGYTERNGFFVFNNTAHREMAML